jgi:hypothetical protein
MTREKMIAEILKHSPCIGEDGLRKYAKHWPENVTLHWLLTNKKRGRRTVNRDHSTWLAQVLLPRAACDRAENRYYKDYSDESDLTKEYIVEAKKLLKKKPRKKTAAKSRKKAR